jgi:hypothetical protein
MASGEERKVASQEIVGLRTMKAIEGMAEVCGKPKRQRGDGSCV